MSLHKNIFYTLFLCFIGFGFLNAQTDVNTAVDVTKVYEQVVKEGYGTPIIYKDLANAHYFKSNYAEAKKWYEKLFEINFPTDATLKFRYKQSLKALDIYSPDNKYLKKKKVVVSSN